MILDDIKQAKIELKLKKRDFRLLLEAYRRKHLMGDNKPEKEMLGLGTPAEYKSKYFTALYGRPIARVSNWFKLTSEGEAVMMKLEYLLPVDNYNSNDVNLFLFTY